MNYHCPIDLIFARNILVEIYNMNELNLIFKFGTGLVLRAQHGLLSLGALTLDGSLMVTIFSWSAYFSKRDGGRFLSEI